MATDLLLVLILILTLFYMWMKNCKKANDPTPKKEIPGMEPTCSKMGNLLDMEAVGEIGKFLEKLNVRYGPIASFWMKTQKVVSIGSAEYFKYQLRIFDRPSIFFEGLCPVVRKNGIQFVNGETGKTRHQAYSKCLSASACNDTHFETIFKYSTDLTSQFESSLTGEPLLLLPHLAKTVGKIAVRCITGEELEDSDAEKMLDNYLKSFKGLGFYLLYSFEDREKNPLPENAMEAVETWRKMISKQIAKRRQQRETGDEVHDNIILDWMLDENMGEDDVMEDTNIIVIGGFHTTLYLVLWCLYYMAKNMDVQEKAYKEINEHIKGDLNTENISKLTYLRQVIDETLRIVRIASYSARVNTDEDHNMGEYVIPKGTPVIHSLSTSLMDPKYFPEPEKYDPERFDPANCKERTNISFSPFGFAGKRICLGYQLAYCEAKVLLASLLKKFQFQCPEDSGEVNPVQGFVSTPSEEIKLVLSLRGH